MKTLILLSICVIYCAATDTKDPKCMWGPSYWCSNLKTAKSCGAVKHCILTVWTHDKPVRKNNQNDEICSYCQNLVTDVRKFLTEKQTQEEIQKYLDQACSIIPEASLQSTCKEMVNDYLPEVFQLIESEMDPQAICAALGLCSSFEDTVRHEWPVATAIARMHSKAGNTYCVDCKKFFSDIKAIIKSNQTQIQYEELIDNVFCPMLGELKDLCKEVMDAYVPQILQMLGNEVDPAVLCASLGMCGNGDGTLLARMKLRTSPLYKGLRQRVLNGEECLLCKTVVTELQTLDRDHKTQVTVENFVLQKICPNLGPLSDECVTTVKEYGQDLFEVLANLLDPDTACQELGFCSATPLLVRGSVKLVNAGYEMEQTHKRSSVKGTSECVLCEFVMDKVQQMLKNNATEKEIIDDLDKVCTYLPSSITKECQEFVNTYADAIVKLLVQEINPKAVCTTLGLCSTKSRSLKFAAQPKVKSTELCDTCQLVWQYVDSLLEQNSTIQQIEQILDKVCNYLPDTYKDQCDDIVKEYGPAVVQLIAQFADPMEICTDIGLCGNTSMTAKEKASELNPKLGELLGARKCTYGPSFWCASRENAKRCNAVPHCEKHVWKKN